MDSLNRTQRDALMLAAFKRGVSIKDIAQAADLCVPHARSIIERTQNRENWRPLEAAHTCSVNKEAK